MPPGSFLRFRRFRASTVSFAGPGTPQLQSAAKWLPCKKDKHTLQWVRRLTPPSRTSLAARSQARWVQGGGCYGLFDGGDLYHRRVGNRFRLHRNAQPSSVSLFGLQDSGRSGRHHCTCSFQQAAQQHDPELACPLFVGHSLVPAASCALFAWLAHIHLTV